MQQLKCLLFLVIVLLNTSCGDYPNLGGLTERIGKGMAESFRISGKLSENLSHTWERCETAQTGSVLYEMNISKNYFGTALMAHKFESHNCSGAKYESYKLADLSYQAFDPKSEISGTVEFYTKIYYKTDPAVEAGVTRIDTRLFSSAKLKFALSQDLQTATVTLQNVRVFKESGLNQGYLPKRGDSIEEIPNVIRNQFVLSKKPIEEKIGGLAVPNKTPSQTGGIPMMNTEEAQRFLAQNTNGIIESGCVDQFFLGKPSEVDHNNFYWQKFEWNDRVSHIVLAGQGYQIKKLDILSAEDKSLNPYLVFIFGYAGQAGDTKATTMICRNMVRSPGIEIYGHFKP